MFRNDKQGKEKNVTNEVREPHMIVYLEIT